MRSLLFTLAVAAVLVPAAAQAQGFVLIRNAKVSGTAISREEVRLIFSGRSPNWSGAGPVQVVMGQEGSPAMSWLADHFFGVSAKALQTRVRQQVFKGDMSTPVMASSDADCAAKVAATDGAVGVVSADTPLPAGAVKLEVQE